MITSTRVLAFSIVAALSFAPIALAQTSFTEVTPIGPLWVTNADEDFWINAVAPARFVALTSTPACNRPRTASTLP